MGGVGGTLRVAGVGAAGGGAEDWAASGVPAAGAAAAGQRVTMTLLIVSVQLGA